MNDDQITLIVAIVGCVTGVCSLVINFYKALVERPKISIKAIKPYLNGFYQNSHKQYGYNKVLISNVRISNKGYTPISITEIYIKDGKKQIELATKYSLNELSIPLDNDYFVPYELYNAITTPITIQPMETIETTLFFTSVDRLFENYKQNKDKPLRVKIHIITCLKHLVFNTSAFELTIENIKNHKKD